MRVVWGLVALAVLIRVAIVVLDGQHVPGGDEPLFLQVARTILHGGGFSFEDPRYPCAWSPGMPTAARAPGPAYWLALWIGAFGENLLYPRLLVAVLSGACTYLMFALGGMFHSPRAGLIAAFLWAFWPSAIGTWYGVTSVIGEPLALLLVVVALYGFVMGLRTGHWKWAVCAGAAIGLASFFRPPVLTLLFFFALWLLRYQRTPRALRLLAVALVAQALVLLPWTVRNYVLLHGLVPISTYSATNFYISNNPLSVANKGAYNQTSPEFEPDAVEEMKQKSEIEVYRYCWARGKAFISTHPKEFAYLVFRRMVLLFDPTIDFPAFTSSNRRFFDGPYLFLALLTLVGLPYLRKEPYFWLCLLIAVNFIYAHLLITTHPRYRQLAEPGLMLMAAPVLATMWNGGNKVRAVLAITALLFIAITLFAQELLPLVRAML